jgi:hypothetical protein
MEAVVEDPVREDEDATGELLSIQKSLLAKEACLNVTFSKIF